MLKYNPAAWKQQDALTKGLPMSIAVWIELLLALAQLLSAASSICQELSILKL